jgi:hypothetical protein
MRHLVIPDIHHRHASAERLIKQHPEHTAVFLGDYFDDYHDTPADAERTASWLAWSLQQPRRIHIMGNHDAAYRWSTLANCPGWTVTKHRRVVSVMRAHLWELCRLHYVVAGARPIVLSHAGFTLRNVYDVHAAGDLYANGRLNFINERTPAGHLEEIEKQARQCLRMADVYNQRHHFFQQGSRTGCRLPAGPWWLDDEDFIPIPGMDQIVGHSVQQKPVVRYLPNEKDAQSTTWFIDTNSKHAALIENGTVTIIPQT